MYEIRDTLTNDLLGWSAFPDEANRMQTRMGVRCYIIFRPNSHLRD